MWPFRSRRLNRVYQLGRQRAARAAANRIADAERIAEQALATYEHDRAVIVMLQAANRRLVAVNEHLASELHEMKLEYCPDYRLQDVH